MHPIQNKRHFFSLVLSMYVAVQMEVIPLVCSFQAGCRWCQSTGSQCQHCMCHSSRDSDPEKAGHTPDSKYNKHMLFVTVFCIYNLCINHLAMQRSDPVLSLPLIVFVLPECVQCRRSASGDQSRRWCLPGRSWPCAPRPLYGRSWPPANHSGWTRPYCGSACRMGGKQCVSWKQTARHRNNAAVSSRVTLTGRDVGFIAFVFNPLTSSANCFGSNAPQLSTLESIRGQWELINGYNNVALRHYHTNDVWMLLISSNRSGRPEVSALWVRCGVSVACLLGGLCTHASIAASSQHFAGHWFVQSSWPGSCTATAYSWSDQTASKAMLSLIDFSTWAARKNAATFPNELPGPAPEVKVTLSGVWLFEYPSSEACLEAEGWKHCLMNLTEFSWVPHLQQLWMWRRLLRFEMNTAAHSNCINTFCNH